VAEGAELKAALDSALASLQLDEKFSKWMARAAQMMCIRNSSDIPINLCQQPRDGEDVQYDGDDVPGHRDAPDNGNAPADETLNVDEIYEGWELALRWYIRISLPTMPISLATLPLKRPSKASTLRWIEVNGRHSRQSAVCST
jgi:hypothetical protein